MKELLILECLISCCECNIFIQVFTDNFEEKDKHVCEI